jgi:hypothetical protein
MKLLFDQNLSPKLAKRLADLFPDSSHAQYEGLDCANDDQVWEHARLNGFAIVSKDADFNNLSVVKGSPPKGSQDLVVPWPTPSSRSSPGRHGRNGSAAPARSVASRRCSAGSQTR